MLDGQAKLSTRFSVAIAAITAAVLAGVAWANLKAEVNNNSQASTVQGRQIEGIETRTRKLEEAQADLRVMKNDVEWIRRWLERGGRN